MQGDRWSDGAPSAPDARSLAVRPVRLRDPGGGRRSAAAALVALTAVVVVAVAIPRLLAMQGGPTPPPGHVATARPSATRTPAPSATTTPRPTAAPALRLPGTAYNAHELVQVVEEGGLDGRLVLVRGSLESIALPCDREPDVAHACVMLAIEGVNLPVVAGSITLPWHDDPPEGDYLVVVPVRGTLVYIGHLAPVRRWPATIDGLPRALLRDAPAGAPAELFVVDGWLVPDPLPDCPASPAPGHRPCYDSGPFLADEPPVRGSLPANSRGSGVLIGDAVGIDLAAEVVEGSFLVAMLTADQCRTAMFEGACGSGARWVVEGVYDERAAWAHVP